MGATSVTGVSGPGSAAGRSKGADATSMGVNKLIGTRVKEAGQVTLNGTGDAVVGIPLITDVGTVMLGFATDTNATPAAVNVTNLTTTAITLKGTAGHVVNWMIVKVY